jgi:hypothetical protein
VFKSKLPAGQPRSLRSIAESKNIPSNLDTDVEYDSVAGVPTNHPASGKRYEDVALSAQPPAQYAVRGKRPFDSNCSLTKTRSGR